MYGEGGGLDLPKFPDAVEYLLLFFGPLYTHHSMNFGLWPKNKKKMSIAERSGKQDRLLAKTWLYPKDSL